MSRLIEIEYEQFVAEKFDFIIGEYATYNHYYEISLNKNSDKIKIGLQSIFVGVFPQVKIFGDKILIGAGESLYIYDLLGSKVKEYSIGSAFYQIIIYDKFILVMGELNIFLLDYLFIKLWEKEFDEIIDLKNIDSDIIELIDYDCNHIFLKFNTGEEVKKG